MSVCCRVSAATVPMFPKLQLQRTHPASCVMRRCTLRMRESEGSSFAVLVQEGRERMRESAHAHRDPRNECALRRLLPLLLPPPAPPRLPPFAIAPCRLVPT